MKIELKLFASLSQYLPDGAQRNQITLDVADGTTPTRLIEDMKLPREACFLVLINGVYLTSEERDARAITEGDALAIWPPIAGG